MEEENGYEKAVYGDGETKLEVRVDPGEGTVWMTQRQLAELFGVSIQNVAFHLKSIFGERGKDGSVLKECFITAPDGKRYLTKLYALPIALEIGRRIKSDKGERLARWFNDQLTEKSQNNRIPIIFDNGDLQINAFASPRENTVWIGMEELANLFEVDRSVVSRHIKNIYSEGELEEGTTCAKNAHMVCGRSYQTKLFNLDVVISVGYRVQSKNGLKFRRWANEILKSYIADGYALDRKRLLSNEKLMGQLALEIIDIGRRVEENKQEADERIATLEKALAKGDIPQESVFFKGQVFDARAFFHELFSKAERSIILVDPYADSKVLGLLSSKQKGVSVFLHYGLYSKMLEEDLSSFDAQYGDLRYVQSDEFHDRFVWIDKDCYHLGSSLNFVGAKTFAVTKMEDEKTIAALLKRAYGERKDESQGR